MASMGLAMHEYTLPIAVNVRLNNNKAMATPLGMYSCDF